MDEFKTLCGILERMDPETFDQIITERSESILSALRGFVDDGVSGTSIFMDFILCAISADGYLAREEYLLVKPSLEAFFGYELTYDDARRMFSEAGLENPTEYRRSVDLMVDVIGAVSPELKDDIILVCMMVCAVDGVISESEREWIAQLIE